MWKGWGRGLYGLPCWLEGSLMGGSRSVEAEICEVSSKMYFTVWYAWLILSWAVFRFKSK